MDDDKLFDIIDRATTIKPQLIIFAVFMLIPSVCKFVLKISFTDEEWYILMFYMLLQMFVSLYKTNAIKNIFFNYFPNEYEEIYGQSTSISSMIRTPFGRLHFSERMDKILTNTEDYDDDVVYLYSSISAFQNSFLGLWIGGNIVMMLYYIIVIA
jgi:hypothetical protein